jgi:hypothetical protein
MPPEAVSNQTNGDELYFGSILADADSRPVAPLERRPEHRGDVFRSSA